MWCSSAVNRAPFCLSAACRTRLSASCARARLCVRSVVAGGEFRLASRLPSSPSAARLRALFETFFGTTRLYDFPASCISGVRPQPSRCAPSDSVRTGEPGISRVAREMVPCMRVVFDPGESLTVLHTDGQDVAFRTRGRRRHSRHGYFVGVGTSLAGRPRLGSRRTELPYRALALRHDGEQH